MEKYNRGNIYSVTLLNDMLERCMVIERDINHLLNISKFVKEYFYQTVGRNKNQDDKSDGDDKIFQTYFRVLELMYIDVHKIINLIENLRDELVEVGCKKNSKILNDPNCYNTLWKLLGVYCTEVVDIHSSKNIEQLEEKHDNIYFNNFRKVVIYKKLKKFNVDDYLTLTLVIKKALERQKARPYELSLSILNLALRGVRYSLDQAIRGCFAGHMVEQEPVTYSHRDLYHVIRYLTMYCDWYCRSMKNFTENVLDLGTSSNAKDINDFFYMLVGVDLDKKDAKVPSYIVVFGDRTSPTLIERYRLISLPIVCAYRPRYWAAVSHEVAHTFVNGLLYFIWALDDICEHRPRISADVDVDFVNLVRGSKLTNFANLLDDIAISVQKLERWGFLRPSGASPKEWRKWVEQVVSTEVLADIFAFMLSGHAYIQTASGLLADRIFPYIINRPIFLIRLYAIYEFAKKILKRRYSISRSVEYILDCRQNPVWRDPIFKCALNQGVLKEVLDYFEFLINNNNLKILELKLVDWYFSIYPGNYEFTNNISNKIWIRKFCKLGKNIGSRLYYSFEREKLFDNLASLNYFGWISCNEDNVCSSKIFSIILNLILNKNVFERFNVICSVENDVDKISKIKKELIFEEETFQMFRYIKSLEWLEKKIKT